MSASEALQHQWLQPGKTKHDSASDSDNEIETELQLVEDLEPPDLRKDTGTDDSSMSSASPDSLISTLEAPSLPSYLSAKRPSLDMTKDNLRDFVSRYSDNPYVFDSPRGIITHLQSDLPSGNESSAGKNLNDDYQDRARGELNIVQQIRRYSQQLHVELETGRKLSVEHQRKSSWSDASHRNDQSQKTK